jgi:hypothetical protein
LLLLVTLCLSAPGWAQDTPAFSLRLGIAGEGSQTPKIGGLLGLVIGGGDTRSVSTVTTRHLPDGRFSQTYATGIERTLYKATIATLFTCGLAGVSVAGDNRSGTVQGCMGLSTAPLWKRPGFAASVVPIGWARNAPAEGGNWDGGFSLTVQVDFH